MKDYEVILLDLGGVVVDLNIETFHNECKKLGIQFPEGLFDLSSQNDFISQFETGKITDSVFLSKFSDLTTPPASFEAISKTWCSMIQGISLETIETLQILRNHYQIYALSNTNNIHISHIDHLLQQQYSVSGLHSLFNGCFFSYLANTRKPLKEYFDKFFAATHIDKNKALFIDDLAKNVQAAKNIGIKALIKKPDVTLKEFLNLYNII